MSSARRDPQIFEFNPKAPDPITSVRRNKHGEQPSGVTMQPIHLSMVIGEKSSGVSTLLQTYAERADTRDTTIIDGPARTWGAEAFVDWLTRHRGSAPTAAGHIVFAADDLHAPRHLLQALAEPDLGAAFRLNAVTYAIDARDPKDKINAATACSADRIVLTHTDRVRPGAVTKLAKALKALNPPAPVHRARHGDIGPARLVDSGLFDPVDGSIDIDRWLCEAAFGFEASRRGVDAPNLGEVQSTLGRSAVRHFAVMIDQPLDGAVLSVFLKLLMADSGADLLRLKGIVATEDHPDRPALIDGREHLLQPLLWLETWPTADRRGRLVFVTGNMSEDWIRTLLATLRDQLKLQAMPELQRVAREPMAS
ncbi:MAG: GTP-binding protein [Geminicoccaceae bacterium]